VERYSHILLIGGGIGVTPLHSVLRWNQSFSYKLLLFRWISYHPYAIQTSIFELKRGKEKDWIIKQFKFNVSFVSHRMETKHERIRQLSEADEDQINMEC
jgi:hypothetical protein